MMKNQGMLNLKGKYIFEHIRDGKVIGVREIDNIITQVGIAEVAQLIGTDTTSGATAFDYIAIGTGTVAAAATDTALGTELTGVGDGKRAAGTGTVTDPDSVGYNDTFQLVVTFNFTTSHAVTESGVFNAATAGTLLSRTTFSAINVANNDSLQVTWKIKVS